MLFLSEKKEVIDLRKTLNDFIETTSKMFQETEMRFQETDKKFKETDKLLNEKFLETNKKINKLEGFFTSQWGKLIEAMVQPAALKLFQQRGYDVTEALQRVVIKKKDLQKEFDLILVDVDVVIVVEVKSTLKIDDVKEHIECIKNFHKYMPEYKDKKVFGAVAYLSCDENSNVFAAKNGMFVITTTGENLVEIKNAEDFIPKDFSNSE